MVNRSKNKGDAAERDAVRLLQDMAPDLVRLGAMRMLGAGRKDDIGDLSVFDDVAVQVKCYSMDALGKGLRSAAHGAAQQQANAQNRAIAMPFALGMVPIPRQPTNGAVRWLASVEQWPRALDRDPVEFKMLSRALTWLKDDDGPHGYRAYPRVERVAMLTGGTAATPPILLAPIEAWLEAYRAQTRRPLRAVVG